MIAADAIGISESLERQKREMFDCFDGKKSTLCLKSRHWKFVLFLILSEIFDEFFFILFIDVVERRCCVDCDWRMAVLVINKA